MKIDTLNALLAYCAKKNISTLGELNKFLNGGKENDKSR